MDVILFLKYASLIKVCKTATMHTIVCNTKFYWWFYYISVSIWCVCLRNVFFHPHVQFSTCKNHCCTLFSTCWCNNSKSYLHHWRPVSEWFWPCENLPGIRWNELRSTLKMIRLCLIRSTIVMWYQIMSHVRKDQYQVMYINRRINFKIIEVSYLYHTRMWDKSRQKYI